MPKNDKYKGLTAVDFPIRVEQDLKTKKWNIITDRTLIIAKFEVENDARVAARLLNVHMTYYTVPDDQLAKMP